MLYVIVFIKIALEIAILWWVIYQVLLFVKGTRAAQLLKGLIIIALLFVVAQWLDLTAVSWILKKILAISVIGFLIIFQPEIRRGLARIGQFGVFTAKERVLDEIVKAVVWLAERKIGAIIAIEREVGLGSYVETGVQLDSKITSELLTTIFSPGTLLHDGGAVIQLDRVTAAGCLFPLAEEEPHLERQLGTRHRAAIGLSEETDAVIIVVSEETGGISVVAGRRFTRDLNRESLHKLLGELLYRPRRK